MRIFVTGITGFLGRNLLRNKNFRRNKILALVREKKDAIYLKSLGVKTVKGDLIRLSTFSEAVKKFKPEVCLHLAWQGIPEFTPQLCLLNIRQSTLLFDFMARETQCRKIVSTGSCMEYGKRQGSCKESDPMQSVNLLGWAKETVSHHGLILSRRTSIKFVWLRLFYAYGPGQREGSLIPSLVFNYRKGKIPKVLCPDNANDFVYINDVVEAINISLKRKVSSGVYNIGSGKAVRIREVSDLIRRHFSRAFKGDEQKQSKAQEVVNFWADTKKSKRYLGWRPKFNLEEGISNYIFSQHSKGIFLQEKT